MGREREYSSGSLNALSDANSSCSLLLPLALIAVSVAEMSPQTLVDIEVAIVVKRSFRDTSMQRVSA